MTFSVRNLPRAEADIRCIANYIHQRSSGGAAAWLNALDVACNRLAVNAESYGEADENEFFDIDVKQALFKTKKGRVYRIVFTIVEADVLILRVRGSGQAPIQSSDIDS